MKVWAGEPSQFRVLGHKRCNCALKVQDVSARVRVMGIAGTCPFPAS